MKYNYIFTNNIYWKNIFNNNKNIEIDIGCGNPMFLLRRAKNMPYKNFIGIENKIKYISKINNYLIHNNIKNIYFIHGDAHSIMNVFFRYNSLQHISINFPDPWWKKKHHTRKLINNVFAKIIVSKLKKGGTIFLQTDVYNFIKEQINILKSLPQLENINKYSMLKSYNPLNELSHREIICNKYKIPIYRVLFQKKY